MLSFLLSLNGAGNKTKYNEEGDNGGATILTNKFYLTRWFKEWSIAIFVFIAIDLLLFWLWGRLLVFFGVVGHILFLILLLFVLLVHKIFPSSHCLRVVILPGVTAVKVNQIDVRRNWLTLLERYLIPYFLAQLYCVVPGWLVSPI